MVDAATTPTAPASAPSAPSSSPAASPSAPASAANPPANGSAPTTPNSSATPQQAAARPEWLGEAHWDGEKNSIKPEFGDHYRELATFKAAEDSRRLTLPKTPEEYKFTTSKDFKVPQGVEFKLDDKSPLLPQARQLIHDISTGKVSGQDAFEKMVDIYAAGEVGRVVSERAAIDAEIGKLGATGTARVTAVQQFLTAQLGEETAKSMGLHSVKQIEGFERLMKNFMSQGGHSYSSAHNDGQQNTRLSDEALSKMSFAERMEYAQKFPQPNAAQVNGHAA